MWLHVSSYREQCSAYRPLVEICSAQILRAVTPAPSTAAYKLDPAICQHSQQYIKEGTVFPEMLPWNVIIGTWVLKPLIKSPSTVSSQRARCADLGASLTDPGCTRLISVVGKDGRKETQMESRVSGKHGSTLIWPVQLLLHRLNPALIYDFYPDHLCGILAYSRTARVSWYYVSFLYIYMYISVCYLGLEDELMCSETSFT